MKPPVTSLSAAGRVVTTTLSDDTGAEVFNSIGRVHLLIASPECTNHSLARGSRPRCDASRRSGWYVMRFIEDLEPEFIVLENVAMMRHWEGYDELYRTLERRYGYKLRSQVLDAADFGVPQNRRRLFIFGARKRQPLELEPSIRRHRPVRTILDRKGTWAAGPLYNGRRAGNTLARIQHGIEQVAAARTSSPSTTAPTRLVDTKPSTGHCGP